MNPIAYILLAIALLYLILRWDVFTDFKKWIKYQNVKHGSEWRLRALLCLPVVILFTMAHPQENGYSWGTFWAFVCSSFMVGFVWWLLFDGWYNLKRRHYLKKTGAHPDYYTQFDWWYIGSFYEQGHSDSLLDKLQFWIGRTGSMVIKIVGVGVWLFIYVASFLKH